MREVLEHLGRGYEWYEVRRPEYKNGQTIPFLVSPKPFYLSSQIHDEVLRIGADILDFMHASDELYHFEEEVNSLLNRGKPKAFQDVEARYLFVRPDILITKHGLRVCEIETSPFGLALAELLNRAYRDEQSLYIVQEFRPSQERKMTYYKDPYSIEQMNAKIRLTPYFSMVGGERGQLLTIKATGCQDTNYIHASTSSINTAVAVT